MKECVHFANCLTLGQTLALSQLLVQVHPLVLLSVADHASRSAGGSRKRVLGVLLGQDNGKTINVANSFAVPFEEDESSGASKNSWFLDHDYIESMMGMYKKINGEKGFWCINEMMYFFAHKLHILPAREKLIGWYHTGPRLRASDQDINDLMKQFIPRPVMVIVDPRSRDTGIPTDAYFAVEEIKDVSWWLCLLLFFRLLSFSQLYSHRTEQQRKEHLPTLLLPLSPKNQKKLE